MSFNFSDLNKDKFIHEYLNLSEVLINGFNLDSGEIKIKVLIKLHYKVTLFKIIFYCI